MATETNNLKLNKPDKTDFYNIDLVNANMNKIDGAIAGKADKKDIPTSLPANGGNAEKLGNKKASEYYSLKDLNVLSNDADLNNVIEPGHYCSSPSNDDSLTILNKPVESSFTLVVENSIGDLSKNYIRQIFKPYYSNIEFKRLYDKFNNGGIWTEWESNFGSTVNKPPNHNLNSIYKSGLYEISPSGAANPTLNSPLDAWGLCIHYEHSSMKHQVAMFVVDSKPITMRRSFGGIPPWSPWSSNDSYQTLPIGTHILNYIAQSYLIENTVAHYRIPNGTGAPTNFGYLTTDNDFYYTVYRMNTSYTRVIALDVRSNREFYNVSTAFGVWTGWVENVKTNSRGYILARKEIGGNGFEGGQINFEKPTVTTLTNDVALDINDTKVRFFEDGTTYRGAYLDLAECASSTGSKIMTNKNVAVQSTAPTSPLSGDLWIL